MSAHWPTICTFLAQMLELGFFMQKSFTHQTLNRSNEWIIWDAFVATNILNAETDELLLQVRVFLGLLLFPSFPSLSFADLLLVWDLEHNLFLWPFVTHFGFCFFLAGDLSPLSFVLSFSRVLCWPLPTKARRILCLDSL
jgi:hypothetical protein